MTSDNATTRTSVLLAALALVALAILVWSNSSPHNAASPPPTRTMQAGPIEAAVTPLTLDVSGAVFQVKLDTHAGALDLDVASSARLRINGVPAGGATWEGQGPGGHHREGTLRFTRPVPAGATVELHITGLAADVTASWTAPR